MKYFEKEALTGQSVPDALKKKSTPLSRAQDYSRMRSNNQKRLADKINNDSMNFGQGVPNTPPKWMRPTLIGAGAVTGAGIGALGGSLFNKENSNTGTIIGTGAGAVLGGGTAAWHSSGPNNKLMGKAIQLFKKFKKV